MNIKASYRYQINEHVKPICIYYFVVLCVYILLFLSLSVNHAQQDSVFVSGDFTGIEMATAIFLFIAGLCSFKETFGMLMQNGISRKTIFTCRVLTALTVAFGMAFIDQLVSSVLYAMSRITNDVLKYKPIFEEIYSRKATGMNNLQLLISNFLFAFFLYLFLVSAGYFISLMFYRLNNAGKIIVGAGVPIGLFTVLPLLDYALTGGRISLAIINFTAFAIGSRTQQPVNALITCTLAFLLFSGLSWLLVRRASVRV